MSPGDRVRTPTALTGHVVAISDWTDEGALWAWVVLEGGIPATFKIEQLEKLDG